ncbi:DUF1330 domain-containing protein [Mycolicibacterium mucogenicum]
MSFPDEHSFREWANSPEYQEISVDRSRVTAPRSRFAAIRPTLSGCCCRTH